LKFRKSRPADDLSEVAVSIDHIRANLAEMHRLQRKSRRGRTGPLTFVNACSSGASSRGRLLSLVETLLAWSDSRGVIATETDVEVILASRFARRVYAWVLDWQPIGIAVHRARWDIVFNHHNPFGVLYTFYGDPSLRLAARNS
jgi:hypothetical protein